MQAKIRQNKIRTLFSLRPSSRGCRCCRCCLLVSYTINCASANCSLPTLLPSAQLCSHTHTCTLTQRAALHMHFYLLCLGLGRQAGKHVCVCVCACTWVFVKGFCIFRQVSPKLLSSFSISNKIHTKVFVFVTQIHIFINK